VAEIGLRTSRGRLFLRKEAAIGNPKRITNRINLNPNHTNHLTPTIIVAGIVLGVFLTSEYMYAYYTS